MNQISPLFIDRVAELASALRARLAATLESPSGDDELQQVKHAVGVATNRDVSVDSFADAYAQSLACGAAMLAIGAPVFRDDRIRDWLLAHASPIWRGILRECLALLYNPSAGRFAIDAQRWFGLSDSIGTTDHRESRDGEHDWTFYLYEAFLAQFDARLRSRHGVFFTPYPIARYIVAEVHRLLVDTFCLSDGLADTTTWREAVRRQPDLSIPEGVPDDAELVRVLDPAVGTGIFPAEVIFLVHRVLSDKWSGSGDDAESCRRKWDDYVARRLLPRLFGFELMLPTCVIATLKLVQALAETGFSFTLPSKLELHLANTLAGPLPRQMGLFESEDDPVCRAARESRRLVGEAPFTVVVGNPPFSGVSRDPSPWIISLLRGIEGGHSRWANYYEVDGGPLGERKTWLQDDYVKFLRFAHWKIESTGCGVVGLVTNHGYLDNPTFRGLRQQLLRTFPRVTVIDLHGNRKKKERAPDGGPDENVFSIEQGTAVGVLCRPPGRPQSPVLRHGELWGTARRKLDALRDAAEPLTSRSVRSAMIPVREIEPQAPLYLYAPRESSVAREYAEGTVLTEIVPQYVTAPVTARDGFVVAFTRDELLARMAEFRDLRISDEEIRSRYFTRTRSPNYPAGDTRSWKLHDARLRMADDPAWEDHVRTCWYRPFDRRVIYWTKWMIDWPREELMRSLETPGNLAIVARRQMLPSQPRNYFWVTDAIALDGLIRSDNRGSEYLFPLCTSRLEPKDTSLRRLNLSDEFIIRAACRVGMAWVPDGGGDLRDSFGPQDLLHYIYAIFFSGIYRERYASPLLSDFPRVFLSKERDLFAELCHLGRHLIDEHLLRSPERPSGAADAGRTWTIERSPLLERGYPKYSGGKVYVNPGVWLEDVAEDVWVYHVGGHQVCRKWLKDRRGRLLNQEDITVYARIVSAIEATLRHSQTIDSAIELYGGWRRAFVPDA